MQEKIVMVNVLIDVLTDGLAEGVSVGDNDGLAEGASVGDNEGLTEGWKCINKSSRQAASVSKGNSNLECKYFVPVEFEYIP